MVQVADPFGSGTAGGGSLGQQLGQYGGTAQSQGVAEGTIGYGSEIMAPGWDDPIPEYAPGEATYSPPVSNSRLASGGAFMLGMVILAMSGFRA
tara:strand:- start:1354 stop:1635 length:282 start_codon:yes stop_codon:yes gene_type:complete